MSEVFGIFGKRKAAHSAEEPAVVAAQSIETSRIEALLEASKGTPQELIALAEKWAEKTEMADNLRQLAGLLSFQETNERTPDDAKRIDDMFAVINSQGRLVGVHLRREDF